MKINEYINRIQSLYSKGTASRSSRLSARHIYNKLVTMRSVMYNRYLNKNIVVSEWDKIIIPCIELIDAPASECNCHRLSNCNIRRTKYKIPNIINSDLSNIVAVTSDDGKVRYSETTWDDTKYISGGKYTSANKYFYVRNNYIYVINSMAATITISAIFENPIEAYDLATLCNTEYECMSYKEMEFPVNPGLSDVIILESTKELIQEFIQFGREDITNNSVDNPINETK